MSAFTFTRILPRMAAGATAALLPVIAFAQEAAPAATEAAAALGLDFSHEGELAGVGPDEQPTIDRIEPASRREHD